MNSRNVLTLNSYNGAGHIQLLTDIKTDMCHFNFSIAIVQEFKISTKVQFLASGMFHDHHGALSFGISKCANVALNFL